MSMRISSLLPIISADLVREFEEAPSVSIEIIFYTASDVVLDPVILARPFRLYAS